MQGEGLRRRSVLVMLAAAASACGLCGVADAQQFRAPKIGRYRVDNLTGWIRDLVIESDRDYAVYELRDGPLYGRGTYSFDGRSVRFLTGPFYTMGYSGSSFVRQDGKHYIRLGNQVDAISMD
jgi:hypothetical protein